MIGVGSAIAVEVVESAARARLGGDREQVQDGVRRAARRGDGGDRVLERVVREDAATARVSSSTSSITSSPARDRGLRLRRVRSPGCRSARAG